MSTAREGREGAPGPERASDDLQNAVPGQDGSPQSLRPKGLQACSDELHRLARLGGPLFLQYTCNFSLSVVAVGFVGHLNDPVLLSSMVLANSLYNVTGYSIISGLAAGMETLCGQAYGACNYHMLGLVLQRAVLLCWMVCLPITLLWCSMRGILIGLRQPNEVAEGAARFLQLIIPVLYMNALGECLKKYLLAQRVVVPGTIITVVTAALAPLYNWLLLFKLKAGLTGAALAFVLANGTATLLLLLYVLWREWRQHGTPHSTWPGIGRGALQGWGTYLSYGVPAAAMICMEWWCYEVVIFMAGLTHNAVVAVGVMGLCFQVSAMAYMSSMSLASAVNTRVSNELGAGNVADAKRTTYLAVAVVLCSQVGIAAACYAGADWIIGAFSNNADVYALTKHVFPVLVPSFIGDGINAVCMAVWRAAGRQGRGAALNLAGYWGLGVPLSAYLGLHLGWSAFGFWASLLITSSLQSVVNIIALLRMDWDVEVQRATDLQEQHKAELAGVASDAALSDWGPGHSTKQGYLPVHTLDQDTDVGQGVTARVSAPLQAAAAKRTAAEQQPWLQQQMRSWQEDAQQQQDLDGCLPDQVQQQQQPPPHWLPAMPWHQAAAPRTAARPPHPHHRRMDQGRVGSYDADQPLLRSMYRSLSNSWPGQRVSMDSSVALSQLGTPSHQSQGDGREPAQWPSQVSSPMSTATLSSGGGHDFHLQ